ncbi:beta-mannanase [Mycolicibacterium sp. BK634]|uniref:hypothetical protein n=1 Tax=Mycolicibacterium sp. BK634 TaxID=2587099 RepID=UPI001619EA45|nr:hypothetical protein [Mycolicibacterium sp. BK634]MBB3752450.1 beta-mannanase [Mycolicibacterium sp. BK634]
MSDIKTTRTLTMGGMSCSTMDLSNLLAAVPKDNITMVHFTFHSSGGDPRERDHLTAQVTS